MRLWLLGPALIFGAGPAMADQALGASACRAGAKPMARVELYFGAGRSGGTGETWRRFVVTTVTPRFPDGLTSFEGAGQWRGPHGLEREATHVLVIFYRPDATSDQRIETIRRLYKSRFRQASVLRADTTACVGF